MILYLPFLSCRKSHPVIFVISFKKSTFTSNKWTVTLIIQTSITSSPKEDEFYLNNQLLFKFFDTEFGKRIQSVFAQLWYTVNMNLFTCFIWRKSVIYYLFCYKVKIFGASFDCWNIIAYVCSCQFFKYDYKYKRKKCKCLSALTWCSVYTHIKYKIFLCHVVMHVNSLIVQWSVAWTGL